MICSPTGSGKTVLLELAIIRELIKLDETPSNSDYNRHNVSSFKNLHALYLAPLKAIVEEKCTEWSKKFAPLGMKCFALTSDTLSDDFNSIQDCAYSNINVILATPEKFDHIIKTDNKSRRLLSLLQLVMIDEIHTLSEKTRGNNHFLKILTQS